MEKVSSNSVLSSVLHQKCPRCQKGNMFVSSNYDLAHFSEMNSECPSCGLHFQVEPGFFTGAMYFSYTVSVFIIAFMTVGITLIFNDPPVWAYIIAICTVTLLLTPLNFRYSRVFMLYLFGGVKPIK